MDELSAPMWDFAVWSMGMGPMLQELFSPWVLSHSSYLTFLYPFINIYFIPIVLEGPWDFPRGMLNLRIHPLFLEHKCTFWIIEMQILGARRECISISLPEASVLFICGTFLKF